MTVVIATVTTKRFRVLQEMVNVAANHPAVQHVIVIWNTPHPMPEEVEDLAYIPSLPGMDRARVTVAVLQVETPANSLNYRYHPSLPIHTEAVVLLDDDLIIEEKTLTNLHAAFKSDPSRIYSFGHPRKVSSTEYSSKRIKDGEANFLLPRMIFHRSFLNVYHDPKYKELRDYVVTQEGHCDDILFAALTSKHTGKPWVQVDAPYGKSRETRTGLSTAHSNRSKLRMECYSFFQSKLDWELPSIEQYQEE
jgi:hypothetical protein